MKNVVFVVAQPNISIMELKFARRAHHSSQEVFLKAGINYDKIILGFQYNVIFGLNKPISTHSVIIKSLF